MVLLRCASGWKLGDGSLTRYRTDVRLENEYVLLKHSDLPSVAVAEVLQRAIEQLLKKSGFAALLVDTTEMEAPPADARDAMWAWCEARPHIRVAILVQSELKRITANMDAVSRRVNIRSFHDRDDAVRWLMLRRAPTTVDVDD